MNGVNKKATVILNNVTLKGFWGKLTKKLSIAPSPTHYGDMHILFTKLGSIMHGGRFLSQQGQCQQSRV